MFKVNHKSIFYTSLLLCSRQYRSSMLLRYKSTFLKRVLDPARANNLAIINSDGKYFNYGDLALISSNLVSKIKQNTESSPSFIACYCPSSADYVISVLACWSLGACFVPLSPLHPKHELEYFLETTKSDIIITSHNLVDKVKDLNVPLIEIDSVSIKEDILNNKIQSEVISLDTIPENDAALVLFTSGTTGRPKGALHTHTSIDHMIKSLVEAWKYNENDRILHFLPLHHLHGVMNKLLCVLWSGGLVEFTSPSPVSLWKRLETNIPPVDRPVSLFMAVPTVYSLLLQTTSSICPGRLERALQNIRSLRLMVSGSAALPGPVSTAWTDLTGHILLERFGMTEIGMALSNPYEGERRICEVGVPLPFIQCRLVDDDEKEIIDDFTPTARDDNQERSDRVKITASGEIRVKGPTLFKEYLNLPDVTSNAFDTEGWFRTGDTAVRTSLGTYKILGRTSVDIIKCGGYKLSALEIERELLSHPQISEAVVVGQPHETLGEVPLAVIIPHPVQSISSTNNTSSSSSQSYVETETVPLDLSSIKEFLEDSLASYKHPRALLIVQRIPKNALGKVNKKTLLQNLTTLDA